jgi:hypothetical protein
MIPPRGMKAGGADSKSSADLPVGSSEKRGGPEEEGKKELGTRLDGDLMDNRVLTCGVRPHRLRQVAQRDGKLCFLAGQIEVLGEGADLKRPDNRTLVDCIGYHCRHKKRDDQNRDEDS